MNLSEKRKLLQEYIKLSDYIATVSGENCEVCLRDYHEDSSTIIHLVNGHLSDRNVGDTITGYRLKKIMKSDYKSCNYVSNYIIINEYNQRVFRSSTFYIKVDEELIGLLCVNFDLTNLLRLKDMFVKEVLFGFDGNQAYEKEFFDEPLEKIIDNMIKNVFLNWDRNIPANKIHKEGNPIRTLYNLKVFNYKGAITTVADLFDISPQTIYRYIKEIEQEQGE